MIHDLPRSAKNKLHVTIINRTVLYFCFYQIWINIVTEKKKLIAV
jgi:hypothetical protein